MTTTEILRLARRLLETADQVLTSLSDAELLLEISDVRDLHEVQGIVEAQEYTVRTEPTVQPYGVVPEPPREYGMVLAYDAATQILLKEYRNKLRRGELGVSWSSGLESESSISAEKAYRAAIADVEGVAEGLKLRLRARRAGTRVQ